VNWYRVELTATGKVARVVKQNTVGEDSLTVFYVEASGAEEAERKAANRYAARKLSEQRKKNVEAGKCRCGRERHDPNVMSCRVCLANKKATRERRKIRAGRNDELRLSKSKERSRDRKAEMRLEVLCELEGKLQELKSLNAVRLYLRAQIRNAQKLPPLKIVS